MPPPQQPEPPNRNEPQLVESDGYLVRGFRRLAEGLGPYAHQKTQDPTLLLNGSITPDAHRILSVMTNQWPKLSLDSKAQSIAIQLYNFRNGPWAHLRGYNDYEVLNHLNNINMLLSAVSAETQAQEVARCETSLPPWSPPLPHRNAASLPANTPNGNKSFNNGSRSNANFMAS